MEHLAELGVLPDAVAVAANRHQVAVIGIVWPRVAVVVRAWLWTRRSMSAAAMTSSQRCRLATFLKVFIGREHGGRVLLAAGHPAERRAWRRCERAADSRSRRPQQRGSGSGLSAACNRPAACASSRR